MFLNKSVVPDYSTIMIVFEISGITVCCGYTGDVAIGIA
jgi:hypothetical protein